MMDVAITGTTSAAHFFVVQAASLLLTVVFR
jgi:hypothetical protein